MTVQKIITDITPLEEIEKINEIIDNLGLGGGVGIRREEFTSSDWVEQQNGKYRYTIYGIKDVISVYRLYNGDYAFVGCDITNDDDNAYIDSPNAFDGFAYVASQEEVLGNRNIGAIIKSLIPQNDAGLHLLDGSLIQGDGIYEEFVNYMAELYGDGTNIPNYFTSESDWQNEVTTYGVCGKFVYDSVNNTVRLPKITGIVEGTTDLTALGDLVEAGLPNINGTVTYATGSYYNIGILAKDGAFSTSSSSVGVSSYNGYDDKVTMNSKAAKINLDASSLNSIYGNSSTVQPQTIKVLYYIVIATSTKTDIQVDIDNIATDLNGKADKDLSNIIPTQDVKSEITSWGMPSDSYIDIPLGSSGSTYTAPANGWYCLRKKSSGSTQYLEMSNTTSAVNFETWSSFAASFEMFIPVKKDDTVEISYSFGGITERFRFIYAEGEI